MNPLSLSSLFSEYLDADDCKKLEQVGNYRSLKKKENVLRQGYNNRDFIFILKGMLRGYYIDDEGNEKDLFLPAENSIAGAPDSLLRNEISIYNFEAIEETKIFFINIDELENIGYENPKIMRFYLIFLKKTLNTMIGRMQDLIAEKPEKRYQNLHINRPDLVKNAKKKYLVNFIGITPNSLSRIRRKE